MDVMVGFIENCRANAILESSKTTYKKKRKIGKTHSERVAKKFKAARENIDTSTEEPRVAIATSARTTSGKSVPSEAHSLSIDKTSSIPSITLTSYIPIPHIFEQVHFQPSLIS